MATRHLKSTKETLTSQVILLNASLKDIQLSVGTVTILQEK